MPSDSVIVFYSALVIGSIALSYGIGTAIRWTSLKLNPRLSPIEKAYLIGGPNRAVEMALFLSVRDGWARHDGSGFFLTRVAEPPAELSQVERELLRALSQSEGLTALQIKALVSRLSSSALVETEQSLIAKSMILSEGEFRLVNLLSLLPMLGAIGFGATRAVHDSRLIQGAEAPVLAILILLYAMAKFKSQFQRRTRLGNQTVIRLREAALARPRPRKNPGQSVEGEDAQGNPFDRLKDIEDDILFFGLSSLIGTAFAPIATFMSDAKKKSESFQWGTVETAPALPDAQNFRQNDDGSN